MGVRVVLAESFCPHYESGLRRVGILPLVFRRGQNRADLSISGKESFSFVFLGDGDNDGETAFGKVDREVSLDCQESMDDDDAYDDNDNDDDVDAIFPRVKCVLNDGREFGVVSRCTSKAALKRIVDGGFLADGFKKLLR